METKTCRICNEEKPLQSFRRNNRNGKISYLSKCNRCARGVQTNRRTYYPYPNQDGLMVKYCQTCGTIKSLDEFVKSGKSYRNCKTCHSSEVMKSYYNSTPEQLERKRLNGLQWRNSDKGRKAVAAWKRQKYASNTDFRDKELAYARRYLKKNRKKYYERYKDKGYDHIHRARKRKQFVCGFTKNDLIKRDGLHCYLCGKLKTKETLQIEHLIPISRGGLHKPENCKLACKLCNATKIDKTVTEFKKWRGDYDRFRIKIEK